VDVDVSMGMTMTVTMGMVVGMVVGVGVDMGVVVSVCVSVCVSVSVSVRFDVVSDGDCAISRSGSRRGSCSGHWHFAVHIHQPIDVGLYVNLPPTDINELRMACVDLFSHRDPCNLT